MEKKRAAALAVIMAAIIMVSFLIISTCRMQCLIRGYPDYMCRTSSLIPNTTQCNEDEANIGQTIDCNPGDIIGVSYNCCCI